MKSRAVSRARASAGATDAHAFRCNLLEGLEIVAGQQQHVPLVSKPLQKLVDLMHQLSGIDDCGVVFTHEHVVPSILDRQL